MFQAFLALLTGSIDVTGQSRNRKKPGTRFIEIIFKIKTGLEKITAQFSDPLSIDLYTYRFLSGGGKSRWDDILTYSCPVLVLNLKIIELAGCYCLADLCQISLQKRNNV